MSEELKSKLMFGMDEDLRLKRGHYYLACAVFVLTTAITWVSNDRRQTAFEATVVTKMAYMEGYEQGLAKKLESVEGTANLALSQSSNVTGRFDDFIHK